MKSEDKRILVILHLYYMESWSKINEYLHNLKKYSFDLMVSYVKEKKDEEVLLQITSEYKNVSIFEVDNKGFDVGPFFECLKSVDLDKYDLVYKIHSKGTGNRNRVCYNRLFKKDDWFEYLYEGILSPKSIETTMKIFKRKEKVGLIAAKNLIIKDPVYKKNLTTKWAEEYGYGQEIDYTYVAGTCFVARAEVLKKIQNLELGINDFSHTKRGKFSLAHAMERIICLDIINQGFSLYGIRVKTMKRIARKIEMFFCRRTNCEKILKDKRFILDDEFVYVYLEPKIVKKYEIIVMPVSKIMRKWNGKIYHLDECAPYKYLNGEKEQYNEYCKVNSEKSLYSMTEERFDKLTESISQKGFDKRYIPVIDGDGFIVDGQHRACVLMKKYGKDYMIDVLKIYSELVNPVKLNQYEKKQIRNRNKQIPFYLYGTGKLAEQYAELFNKEKIEYDAFVVTKKSHQQFFYEKRIFSIDEIENKDSMFYLALNERNSDEVIEILKEKGFYNFAKKRRG